MLLSSFLNSVYEMELKDADSHVKAMNKFYTNMAGALAARKIHVQVGHVEAGLRSCDWRMPEEHNRVIIDHISEYLFAPTQLAKRNLLKDGVTGKVFVVGNTIVDATLKYSRIAKKKKQAELSRLTKGMPYALLTLHREENVDNKEVLSNIIGAVKQISSKDRLKIIFPIHPRTKERLRAFGMQKQVEEIANLRLIEPLGYLVFLAILSEATLVMTDSGGIQEESCILGIPCLTLRESTERQETIELGSNRLAGTQEQRIVEVFESVVQSMKDRKTWKNPYGDGKASRRIVDICINGRPEDEFRGY